jgi:putative hydrolase of the HAD superfamily
VIRAVVLDVGGVLEILDDTVFPDPWCQRHGVPRDMLAAALAFPADPVVGAMTEAEIADHLRRELGLDDAQLAEFVEDQWRWYVGELDRPRREACWEFEGLVDVLVHSHEVGMKKPDPRVYAHTTELLGVEPSQLAFLDDWLPAVEAARAFGWHAVHHLDTAASKAALEVLIRDRNDDPTVPRAAG